MNDFSFTNRAYDLLLGLKEDGIIHKIQNKPSSIKDLRLLVDMAKDAYPLYSTSEPKTISEIVNDLFKVKTTMQDIISVNYEKEYWRPIKIQDIEPGTRFKIVENTHQYYHTFWTYDDTHKIIPLENTTLDAYNQAFMYIWEKAKKGKVFMQNVFKHRIKDIVKHRNDPDSYGTIKGRMFFNPNQYSVTWQNTGTNKDVPLTYWFNENHLINLIKLEVKPMKTELMTKTKQYKALTTIQYKEYNPEEWINENVIAGRDKEVYKKLLAKNTVNKEFGWVEKERILIIDKHKDILSTVLNFYKYNTDIYKDVKIIATKPIISQIPFDIPKKPIHIKCKTKRQLNNTNYTNKLVCVKHMNTGVIARIEQSLAQELIVKNGNYDYVSKHEFRKYRTELSINKKKNGLTEPKKEKKVASYTTIGGINGVGNSPIIEGIIRKNRRANTKLRKHSHLVQEQFVTKIIPEVKEDLIVTDSTWESPWANQVIKIIRPAHTIIKRILTRIEPHKEIKLTEEVKLQRLERSAIDKSKYLQKKGLKSLPELIEEFSSVERRGDRFSTVEKWSISFDRIFTLIISGIAEVGTNLFRQVKSKTQRILIDDIIKEQHSLKWEDSKISDFIRYLRLTAHGIFGKKTKYKRPENHKKLAKIKKPIQSVEFEVMKVITKIDYSKLKQNLPKENNVISIKFNDANGEIEKHAIFKEGDMYTSTGDFLCSLRDVIAWKSKKDKEYQDIIIDEGGGITQVPVKFRRKNPEHLKKYFKRQREKKNV